MSDHSCILQWMLGNMEDKDQYDTCSDTNEHLREEREGEGEGGNNYTNKIHAKSIRNIINKRNIKQGNKKLKQ